MSIEACIFGTPFSLNEGASPDSVRALVQEHMDDYQLDLEEAGDGKYQLHHPDTFEAGQSVEGRLNRLAKALEPLVSDAFVLTFRDCDTSGDERDSDVYSGPDEQSILAFRQQRAIAAALETLRGVPGLDKQIAALQLPAPDAPSPTGDKFAETDAIMAAAYDFRDAHLTGSKNLQRTAHAELEAAVRDAMCAAPSSQTPGHLTEPAFDLAAALARLKDAGFEISEDPDQEGMWHWWHPSSATGSDISYESQNAACRAALACLASDQVTMTLNLEVTYQLNGYSPDAMRENLNQVVGYAIENSMLTGSTAAEVNDYKVSVNQVSDLGEDELTEFMADRIENGDIDLGDLPRRLARYGLMSPASFAAEMDERMQNAEFGRYADGVEESPRQAP